MKRLLRIYVRTSREEPKQQLPRNIQNIVEALEVMEQKVQNISKKAENLLALVATV